MQGNRSRKEVQGLEFYPLACFLVVALETKENLPVLYLKTKNLELFFCVWLFQKHIYICDFQNQSNSLTAKTYNCGLREQRKQRQKIRE